MTDTLTIFAALSADHDKQRRLAEDLVRSDLDYPTLRRVFAQLKRELIQHAAYETACLYEPLLNLEETRDAARRGMAEHRELEDFIAVIERLDGKSLGWLAMARTLRDRLRIHLQAEEAGIFRLAGELLNEAEKRGHLQTS